MDEAAIARIFKHGGSQAVRLPLAFRLPGDRVRVSRVGRGILLEPIFIDPEEWLAELNRFADIPFPEEPEDPPVTPDEDLFP